MNNDINNISINDISENSLNFSKVKKYSYLITKRLFDIILSLFGILFLIPLSIIIKISYILNKDYSSIFYTQTRIGKNGKEFKLYKFRSMIPNADEVLKELMDTNTDIFNEYSKGKGYKAITNQINKLGYKTKKGNDFSVGSIRDILTNPVYIGEIRYNVRQNWSEKRRRNINPNPIRVKGKHEAIIDRELWDKVQLILESKKGKPSRIYDGEYPLTGILRCPKCGAGMVISRTTNTLADGSKKRIAYYCCGNWKNKGTSVCNSNTIRVDKANEYVFKKIEELVSNEAVIKAVVKNINKERKDKVKPAKRLLGDIDKELEKLDKRKRKIFEAYEDDILTKAEFQIRKDELNEKIRILEEEKKPLLNTISEDVSEEIPYEFIKDILKNFSKVLNSNVSREQQKKLLHMIISEITMNESREIDSIKLNINDKLVEYLVKEGGVPIKGIPFSFMLRNVGLKVLDLDVVI